MRAILRNFYLHVLGNFKKPKPGIHIINSHYVTPNYVDIKRDAQMFENYLQNLNQFAKFISLEEATQRILNKDIPKDEVLITFTFDDGFEECYTIIAPLLEKYFTRGAFFINANYIGSDSDYQNEFHKRVAIATKTPMSWKQVSELHHNGHLIGSHNLDHNSFAELSEEEIIFQVKENKKILEEKLEYRCDYFAWTYGQLQHFPPQALELTLNYHPFIYSGTNYQYYFSYEGKVLNRRHQEAFWPKSHTRYFLSSKKAYNENSH